MENKNEKDLDYKRKYQDLLLEIGAVMESTPDAIYTVDGTGRILRFNSMLGEVLEVDTKNILGKNLKELKESGAFPESVALLCIEQKRKITLTQTLDDGKHVMISSYPLFDGEQVAFVVTKIRDMTEIVQMKNELEQIKRLSSNYYRELKMLRNMQENADIIAQSQAMIEIVNLANRVAQVDTTVLISGESGTGKEVIAKMIHQESKRSKGPFIKINCGAIPENLLESELFGYVEGSFTGALKKGKIGLFETAKGGTLLLDEIADLPLILQVKLLRVLQDKEFYRVGGRQPTKTDVRIIAATNKNLQHMVEDGRFREDLFYRLNVVPIVIPPLKDRKSDIIPLVYYFIRKFNTKHGFEKSINSDAVEILVNYEWPGNVRELENTIENMMVMSTTNAIGARNIPKPILEKTQDLCDLNRQIGEASLGEMVASFEKRVIAQAMERSNNVNEAAKLLGVHRTTMVRKWNRER
ncbi:MAG TPA: transcriptional regulator [Eubacteriaceae bacterium]|nr:transcriptional regulator [Eubacteriaceae bacterium]